MSGGIDDGYTNGVGGLTPDMEQIFLDIIASNTEDVVRVDVGDAKGEYVWDWEDDFDSLDDAYEEQGRGAAESLVLNNLIKKYGGAALSVDDHGTILDRLAEHYYLNTN